MIKLTARSKNEFERIMRQKARQIDSDSVKKKVGKASLEPIEDLAKDKVQVKTGKLKNSIGIVGTSKGASLVVTEEYAASEEYLGRPYMRPAIKQGTPDAIKIAGQLYKIEVEKEI